MRAHHLPHRTHRTLIVFTAAFSCCSRVVLYSRATVAFWGAGTTRRWQMAVAIFAALSLFTAVTAGWAGRGSVVAATAAPRPAASSQANHAGANAGHVQLGDRPHATSYLVYGSSPTHQKPAKNAWMTRDRPPSWNRLSSHSVWSPLPASFTPRGLAPGFGPGGAHFGAPPAALADRDILTQLCVARS
jgi:hypothetical protein